MAKDTAKELEDIKQRVSSTEAMTRFTIGLQRDQIKHAAKLKRLAEAVVKTQQRAGFSPRSTVSAGALKRLAGYLATAPSFAIDPAYDAEADQFIARTSGKSATDPMKSVVVLPHSGPRPASRRSERRRGNGRPCAARLWQGEEQRSQ